jgi:hypothetical protein
MLVDKLERLENSSNFSNTPNPNIKQREETALILPKIDNKSTPSIDIKKLNRKCKLAYNKPGKKQNKPVEWRP